MGGRDWTDEERQRLRALWNSDMKMAQVAEHFPGRTEEAVYQRGKAMKLGERRIPQSIERTLSWLRIAAQFETGPKTAKQIALATGIDIAQIHVLLKRRRGRLVRVSGWMIIPLKPPSIIPFGARPWDAHVFDTMTAWAGHGNRISLDNLCAALGIEGKGTISGADVWPMIQAGKIAEVAKYCRHDVEITRNAFYRLSFAQAA